MTQISRLHSSDMANGNIINADHINNELNQLVSESNAQDTRLVNVETGTVTLSGTKTFSNIPILPASDPTTDNQAVRKSYVDGLVKSTLIGLVPKYVSGNQIQIDPGQVRDEANTATMVLASAVTVSMATSGANGLDTGSESANSWYYVWLIGKTDGTVAGLFSLSNTSPTLPTGYTRKRLLPIAIRNDASSNLIPFMVTAGWPFRPTIMYPDCNVLSSPYQVLNAGTATSWSGVSCTSIAPPISKAVFLWTQLIRISGSGGTAEARQTGSNGSIRIGSVDLAANYGTQSLPMLLNASQSFDYIVSVNTNSLYCAVMGYVVTEVN